MDNIVKLAKQYVKFRLRNFLLNTQIRRKYIGYKNNNNWRPIYLLDPFSQAVIESEGN